MEQELFEVRVARTVAVPVERLWAAWTEPELLARWWGPTGFTCPVARLDVRVGGVSLVAMRPPAAFGMPDFFNTWTYSVVDQGRRLEYVSRFTDADGRDIGPAAAGVPPEGVPDEVPHLVTFTDVGADASRVDVVERGYTTAAARDMSAAGMRQCLDGLAAALAAPGPEVGS